jgi:DNA-binding HxlR family transcriptional regulator
MANRLARSFNCPTEFALEVLGGKWKTVILAYLRERSCRYAELRQLIPKLSDKVLTERLSDLQAAGLIERRKVEGRIEAHVYMLTPLGQSLGTILTEIYIWGNKHAAIFGVSVGQPLWQLTGCGPET